MKLISWIFAAVSYKIVYPADEKLELGGTDSAYYPDKMGILVPRMGRTEL